MICSWCSDAIFPALYGRSVPHHVGTMEMFSTCVSRPPGSLRVACVSIVLFLSFCTPSSSTSNRAVPLQYRYRSHIPRSDLEQFPDAPVSTTLHGYYRHTLLERLLE